MVWYCCVSGCKMNTNIKGLSFFSIPRHNSNEWLKILQLTHVTNICNLKICALHFLENDMYMAGSIKKLRKNVYPSVFFNKSTEVIQNNVLCEIQHERSITENQPSFISVEALCLENTKLKSEVQILEQKLEKITNEHSKCQESYEILLATNKKLEEQLKSAETKNEEIRIILKRRQVTLATAILSIERFWGNDKKLRYYTGVQTFNIFYNIFKYVLPEGHVHHLKIYSNAENNALRKNATKISPENQLFLTLTRLRRAFQFDTLGDLFGVSSSTAQKIFSTWLNLLHFKLGQLEIWPHRDVILQNAPATSKERYQNVVGSIDCTEFLIEQPSSLVRQSQCYSNYKGSTTLKSLIMTDPNGYILFASELMSGSISDKQIVIQSGFLAILEEKVSKGEIKNGDIILADKGFNVESLFSNIDINLNIPKFRITGYQFAAEEVQQIRTVAHERVHVERAIGRLKSFRILSNKVPISLLGSFDQIYFVCSMLINFRHPLRSRDKA